MENSRHAKPIKARMLYFTSRKSVIKAVQLKRLLHKNHINFAFCLRGEKKKRKNPHAASTAFKFFDSTYIVGKRRFQRVMP